MTDGEMKKVQKCRSTTTAPWFELTGSELEGRQGSVWGGYLHVVGVLPVVGSSLSPVRRAGHLELELEGLGTGGGGGG